MIGLVAIGFVGGFFTHAQLTKKHLLQVAKERTLGGFEERLFRIVRASDEQQERLSKVVREYSESLHRIHAHAIQDRKQVFDSLRDAMKKELDEEQMKRLEEFIHRHLIFRAHREEKMHRREKMPQ